jgi:hypothetical protein
MRRAIRAAEAVDDALPQCGVGRNAEFAVESMHS